MLSLVTVGFTKKAEALAKQKGCDEIRPWIKSLSNHLYWCAASSDCQSPDVIVAKWQSVGNHIQNIHSGHSQIFPACEHPELTADRGKKKWLKPSMCLNQDYMIYNQMYYPWFSFIMKYNAPGNKSCEKLVELINNTRLLRDIGKMSPAHQTSNLEAFHRLVCQFACKVGSFSL